MSTILKLVRLQIDNKFEIFRTKNLKSFFLNLSKFILLIGAIFGIVSLLFQKFKVLGFNINSEVLFLIIIICQLITLIFSIFCIKNNLYENKDNEFLIVLPCNANQLFLSKMIIIYLEELFISIIYSLPLLLSVGIIAGFSFWYFLLIPAVILILPIFPLAIASILSIPFMMITKTIKKNTVVSFISTLILFAFLIIIYSRIILIFTKDFGLANLAQQLKTVMNANNYILNLANGSIFFYPFTKSLINLSYWYYFIIYLGVGVLLVVAMYYVIKPFYFKTMQKGLENETQTIQLNNLFQKKSSFKSLIIKEFLSIIRSNNYLIQFLLFTFLMPIIVFCYDSFIIQISVSQAGEMMILGSHVLTFSIVAILSNVMSASAISREGASFYYMKIVPKSYYMQIGAKLAVNIILSSIAIFITGIISLFYFEWWKAILSMICVWFTCIGHACYSLDLDIKSPELKWFGYGEMSSINKNTTKSLVMGLLLALVIGLFVILTAKLNAIIIWTILLLFVIGFALRKIYVLGVRTSYKFNSLEV